MYRKLVKYDEWHFAEVDPIRLRRTATQLRDQIVQKIKTNDDRYSFYTLTMPFLEAAIRGEITASLDGDETPFISANYSRDESEGDLPIELDREFRKAVAGFDVAVQGLSLEESDKLQKDGEVYGWVEFEEEGDWPGNVKFP
jgi:hypothetical protein